jgi:hypothetical protein
MAGSVGAAAAQGLESGVGLGMRLRAQEQQEAQLKRQNLLADQQLERQREQDKRLEDDRALEAINKQFDDLRAEGEGYFAQYGKAVPDEIGAPYRQRVDEVSGARNTMLRKRYEPIIKAEEQRAKDIAMRLQSGDLHLRDVAPKDLYHALSVQTRRDPTDLIGRDGQPSRVSTAVTDIMDGLQYGNEGAVLRGTNVLLEPDLKVGVGEPSPHGGTIVGKQIVKLIPHPTDPNMVLPVVKVYVRRGTGSSGDVARADHVAEEGAPPGATGYYLAPITEHRSTDPNDPPKPLDLQKAMDYASQMQTLSTAISHPEIASMIERGRKEAGTGNDFQRAFYAVRGRMPAKAVEYKSVPRGGLLAGFDTATGKPTGDVISGPEVEKKETGLAAQIQAVQDYAAEQGISEAEAAVQLQQQGLLRAPKGAKGKGGGLAGPGGAGPTGVGGDLTGEEFLKTLKPEDAKIVKGLAEGTIKPESISTKDNRREHMLALSAQYAPDGGGGGKPLPENVRKAITEVRDNAATIKRLAESFQDAYAAKGVFGLGADKQLAASAAFGKDPDAVDWWKNYRRQAELVERHAMFGASLTTGEQEAWRSADIGPGMAPAVVKRNLATRQALAQKVLQATRQDLIDAGHSEKRIGALADRDMTIEPPADTARRKSGQVEQPEAAAAPFRLPSDRKAAAAAYAKLPSGTTFVDPDGKTRRKP